MRVIAGTYKGRALAAPKGVSTRPTTDRVKESLMSALVSAYGPLEGARVLDAFAGSGALGIECLSRGAESVHFFERDKAALAALERNVGMLGADERAVRVFRADVLANPPLFGAAPYDIVLLDPPYALPAEQVCGLLSSLHAHGRIAEGAVASYEHDAACDAAPFLAASGVRMDILSTRRFSKTVIDLIRFA